MPLHLTEALKAMATEAMVIVRATVEIAVAASVVAKKVTTLAVARAVLSRRRRGGYGELVGRIAHASVPLLCSSACFSVEMKA